MSVASRIRIPLSAPDITEPEIAAVTRVLRGSVLSQGPLLEEFEGRLKKYVGAAHAVAVNSGTSGLHLLMRALGIGEGDEVIVPSFAFVAAANAVCYERAAPVFAEIEPETLGLDPRKIEAAITPGTRAILLIHTFGYPADVPAIQEIARRHNLLLIEDACESLGAEITGRKVGTFGVAGVFAFYPNKQVTAGEGGVVVMQDVALAESLRSLRNQGRRGGQGWLQHVEIGYSYRLSDLHCALGAEQLKRIDVILRRREAVALRYYEALKNHPDLILPPRSLANRKISWFVYVVRLADRFTRQDRDWIWEQMLRKGIGCGRYFAPIHLQPAYRKEAFRKTGLRLTERIAERTLALPFFNQLEDSQIAEVAETLTELLGKACSR